MPLAGFTARATGGRMVAALREKIGDAGAVGRFHERTAVRYTELLGNSKGVLMKAGQMLSMVDAGSIGNGSYSPYQDALARLQANAPPMDPGLAKEILQTDLGRRAEELFTEFTDQPIAAASIGQVHRAVLHDGRQVAVKIQYPGVAEAIREDLANTELLATFFRFASSAAGIATPDPRPVAREIAEGISEEIDYRHEAANITTFGELYREHPFIRVPEVINEASSERVLTMTLLEGMDWTTAQHANQALKNTWAEVVLRFVTGSYRHGNLFNADPHPGNYRFGLDGSVGFVDFGCVTVLPERRRRAFVGMARATIDGRKHDLRDLMAELGFLAEAPTLSVDEAYQWMAQILYEALLPQPVTYTGQTSQRAIHALLDIRAPDHPIRRMSVPAGLVFFTRYNLSLNTIFAALGATIYTRATLDDLDGIAEPITRLGKLHDVWVRQSGLPHGLNHHNHP
jgi:predicted unusual protein kinase regulating ubiquinone biosynthesis (AarF/ABC1/UbiB family)